MLGNYRVAAQLAASRVVLSCTELFSYAPCWKPKFFLLANAVRSSCKRHLPVCNGECCSQPLQETDTNSLSDSKHTDVTPSRENCIYTPVYRCEDGAVYNEAISPDRRVLNKETFNHMLQRHVRLHYENLELKRTYDSVCAFGSRQSVLVKNWALSVYCSIFIAVFTFRILGCHGSSYEC
jgi:hypothetical protein